MLHLLYIKTNGKYFPNYTYKYRMHEKLKNLLNKTVCTG